MFIKKQYNYILLLPFFFLHLIQVTACDLDFSVSFNEPICHGESSGNMYATVTSGIQPYLYSFDGGNTFSTENSIDNIPAGNYQVVVQGADGCELTQSVLIEEPNPLLVELGPDTRVELGESVFLSAQISSFYDQLFWEFEEPVGLQCDNCPEIEIILLKSQTVYVNVQKDGCIGRDSIFIEVEKQDDIFIPNAFTPNGDGYNDFVTIYGGDSVAKIKKFEILDNWGNVVFAASEFPVNEDAFGWDGNFDGKKMKMGIFVYCAEAEYIDGEVKTFCGDILLMY